MRQDRAATEVLGYVLVIALVTVTIGVVMTLGVGGLESSQDAEQVNNIERAFDVLAHNVEQAVHHGAPTRSTEVRLIDGSIAYGDPVTINVTHDGEPIDDIEIETDPLVYDSGDGIEIVYEGGAIVRTVDDHSVMLQEPPFVLEADHILINGIHTRPLSGTARSIDQAGTALIRKENLGSVVGTSDASGTVNITVESPRAGAWAGYLADQDLGTVHEEPDRVILEIENVGADVTVAVVRSRVRVTLSA